MRWGIFSDIHANLEAWVAVKACLNKERIDRYLCLGDIVGYGADPRKCIAEIKKLNPLTVAGNHDWASINLLDAAYFNPAAQEALTWTANHIAEQDKQFLKGLKLVHQEEELTLVHGSLHRPEQFKYVKDVASAKEAFRFLSTRICFVGHSHSPVIFIKKGENYRFTLEAKLEINDYSSYIVNVGSVGQPRDGDPRAAYVVYDSESQQLQIKRVRYDIKTTQKKIIKAGLPEILAKRLAVGR